MELAFILPNGREEIVRACKIRHVDGRVLATGTQDSSPVELDVTGYRQALMLWEPIAGLTNAGRKRRNKR